jgi:CBS domain containing-hemolysin-like protein
VETGLRLALVAVLIGANAFFVAVEFSLVAVDRNRVEAEAAAGGRRARLAAGVLSRLSFHLSGAQLGITVTSLLLGFLAEPAVAAALEPLLGPIFGDRVRGWSIALALVLATVVQMIVGELIPKSIALARAHGTVIRMAPLVRVYGVVAGPLVRALNGLANATLRRFGIEPREELATTRTLDELMVVISAAADEGELDTEARQLLERSIRFGEKTAADVIVPRHAVEAMHDHDTVADLVSATARTGFARFPVMGRNLDDIVGTVHVRRVFEVDPAARERTAVATLMGTPTWCPRAATSTTCWSRWPAAGGSWPSWSTSTAGRRASSPSRTSWSPSSAPSTTSTTTAVRPRWSGEPAASRSPAVCTSTRWPTPAG